MDIRRIAVSDPRARTPIPMNSFRFAGPLLVAVLTASCASAPSRTEPPTAPAPAGDVAALADEYWQAQLSEFPEMGTYLGAGEFDDRLTDISPAAREARRERLSAMLARVDAVDTTTLAPADALTLGLLRTEVSNELDTDVCQTALWGINALGGPQVDFLQFPSLQPIGTPEQGVKLLARYRAMPGYIDAHIANLRTGLESGYRAPGVAVERTVAQLDGLIATPDSSLALLDPLRTRPVEWSASAWAVYREQMRDAVAGQVMPAFRRYRDFLRDVYLPRSRDVVGVSANREGEACYRALARAHTSLDLPPEEIHAVGLREMERIHTEMRAITRRLFDTEDLPAVFGRLREDPRYTFDSRDAVENAAREAVGRAQARLPEVFGRLPQAPLVVKPMEAFRERDAPAAYYFQPATDGSRPGTYYVNTYQPESRPRYTAEVLAFHEAVPGHHLQIALAQELEGIPEFRKHAGTTAFVEGWALYSERVADDLGLYSGDLDRLGMLSFDAWRAARLITDTGMHALGWTRERAIEYMLANTALTPLDAANEIDRYIVWPGQALAYKMGQLEILRLREQAREQLGDRFDIRAFHDVVLGAGAVTLPILSARVEGWIAEQQGAAAQTGGSRS